MSMVGSGIIYAHVFENLRAGIARNLFWNMFIGLQANTDATEEDAISSIRVTG